MLLKRWRASAIVCIVATKLCAKKNKNALENMDQLAATIFVGEHKVLRFKSMDTDVHVSYTNVVRCPAARRPYPLRTVIVGEGKTAQALEAIAAMRQTELIPPGCHIDVVEGRCATATTATGNKSQQESEQGDQEEEGVEEEEDKGGASRSFLAACSTPLLPLLKSLVLRSIFGRFCCMSGAQRRRRRQLDSAG